MLPWALLLGSASFFIPGIGPIVVGGQLVSTLAGALVCGGLSLLGVGLCALGIPEHTLVEYKTAIQSDKFLLIAKGTPSELREAREILEQLDSDQVHYYSEALRV
jgi:hypothetical protein